MLPKANYCIVTSLIFIILLLIPVHSSADDGGNIALHFGFSSIFGAAGETFLHYKTRLETPGRILCGTLIGSLPGLVKELTDSRFSGADMAANVAGALLGSVIANHVNNRLSVRIEHQSKKVTVSLSYNF